MTIETLFSESDYARKTHFIIDGFFACHVPKKYVWFLWDSGGEIVSKGQLELLKNGIDPDNRVCKYCLKKAMKYLQSE